MAMEPVRTAETLGLLVKVGEKNGLLAHDLAPETKLQLAGAVVGAGLVPYFISPVLKCTLRPCETIAGERYESEAGRHVFYIKPDEHAAERLEAAFSRLEDQLQLNQGEAEFDLPPPDNVDKVKPIDRVPAPELAWGEKPNAGFNQHTQRGIYEVMESPDNSKSLRHTWADLNFYHAMKKAWQDDPQVNPEWGWRCALMLTPDVMDGMKPHEWMRNICVLNGLSTNALSEITGIHQAVISSMQNRSYSMSYDNLRTLLDTDLPQGFAREGRVASVLPGPLLGLPQLGGAVDPEIEGRILNKFGFGHSAIRHPTLWLHAMEEVAIAYKENRIPREDVEPRYDEQLHMSSSAFLDVARVLLKKRPDDLMEDAKKSLALTKSLARGTEVKCEIVIEALHRMNERYWDIPADVFERQMKALEYLPALASHPTATALSADEAFEFAALRAQDFGQFRKDFREARYISYGDIVAVEGGTRQNVSDKESKKITKKMDLFLEQNAYGLPVDESGKVRSDVREYLQHLNKGLIKHPEKLSPKAQEGWMTLGQVLSEHLGMDHLVNQNEGVLQSGRPHVKLELNPQMKPYEDAWAALTAHANLKVGQATQHEGMTMQLTAEGDICVNEKDALKLIHRLENARRNPGLSTKA